MPFRKIFFYLLISLQSQVSFGQWHQLPAPGGVIKPFPYTTILPEMILPLGNGKIIYSMHVIGPTPSSPKYINYYFSYDDLTNYSCALCPAASSDPWMISYPGLGDLKAYNDSTLSWISSSGLYQGQAFTMNNFKTRGGFSYFGSPIAGQFVTGNYIYALLSQAQSVLPLSDTLNFVRTSATSTVHTYVPLKKYDISCSNVPKKMNFLNDSVGYFISCYRSNSSKSTLLKTNNYGNTWSELMVDSINPIQNYSFPVEMVGYITKANGIIHKTIDGGSNWVQLTSPTNSINCIQFANDTMGYIGGNSGQLWKTTDGGVNWLSEVTTCTVNIADIYTFGDVAYFTDFTRKVFKNKPDVVGITEYSKGNSQFIIYPNPSNDQITIDLSGVKEKVNTIKVSNVFGEIVEKKNIDQNPVTYKLSVKNLASGTYFVLIECTDKVLRKTISVIRE